MAAPVEEQRSFWRIAGWLNPGGVFMGTLGRGPWTVTEQHWLRVEGATMYWSHADAQTYHRWLDEAGFEVLAEEFVPEGDGGHQLFKGTH